MSLEMKVLVVGAGGGAGGGLSGSWYAAGGGGGQVTSDTNFVVTAIDYNVTVGTGGTDGGYSSPGGTGGSSIFSTITSVGGQGAQNYGYGGQSGSGNSGGNRNNSSGAGGGGGGDSGEGQDGQNSSGGNGGSATADTITGATVYYGGGGGGRYPSAEGTNGAGTYGRGGKATSDATGKQGIVIISWVTADYGTCTITGTGNTITTSGSNSIATFIVDGVFGVRVLPTVTTQAATDVTATTVTGNGNITDLGGYTSCTKKGFVYSTSTHTDPGNIAPASSAYESKTESTGTYTTGAFTTSITGLISRTTYYARAYTYNTSGYSYGAEVTFTTIGFTNPANIYSSDDVYATLTATSGDLTIELSKDAGVNWNSPRIVTFTSSDSVKTFGSGSTELWGANWTRADLIDANFRVKLSQGNISQVYKTFGFTTGTETLTGIEIRVEGKYASSTLSLDLLEVKIYYGTSSLQVQAGSQAFASNGRKAGEGAGAGTGVLVFYDGNNWIACDTGANVAA